MIIIPHKSGGIKNEVNAFYSIMFQDGNFVKPSMISKCVDAINEYDLQYSTKIHKWRYRSKKK